MQSVDHTPLTGLFKYWIWFRFFVLRSGIFEPPGNSHLKMHGVLIGNFEKNPLEVPRCWFVAGVAWKFFLTLQKVPILNQNIISYMYHISFRLKTIPKRYEEQPR